MDTGTYPEEKVSEEINDNFIPLKISVHERPEEARAFRDTWHPTFVVLDADLTEHYRSVGGLPPEDFRAQLILARGKVAMNLGRYKEAAELFGQVASECPATAAAPEALYFLGGAEYKAGNRDKLEPARRLLVERYPQSEWTKKATFTFRK